MCFIIKNWLEKKINMVEILFKYKNITLFVKIVLSSRLFSIVLKFQVFQIFLIRIVKFQVFPEFKVF